MSFQWRDSEMRRDIDSAAANKHDHNDNHLRPPPNTSDAASINADTASTITTLSTARMDNKADSPSQHQEQQDLKKDARSRTSTQQNRILEIEKHYRKRRRVNGLQWPLNPLQFVGWATLMGLTVLSFGAFIPALPEDCHFPLFVWCAVIFGAHYLAHFLALAVDPADPGLRGRSSTETVPEFDRNKHSHVIENGRCHLCNITIRSNRSKHCSVCNKCVDRFDHHCKWLNHCIGRRNYKIFLVTVATAILGSLTTMSLCVADITLYLHDRNSLELILIPSTNPLDWALLDDAPASPQNATFRPPVSTNNEVTFVKYFAVMGHPVSQPAFLVSSVVAIVFSGIVVLLLMHLLVFHVYMIKWGITTYEYLRGYHQDHALREAAVASERTAELAEAEALKKKREERLERFKSHWCLGTLFRRQQNKVKDATFSHPNRKKSMMEDPSVLLGSNQSGPRKGSFPRSTTPTKENPWPGRSRIELPGRLAPIAHEERRNDEFYDENEAPSKNNRRSDQERKNDQSSSHFDQSRQRTKSSVPVLPKINEATPPSTADSDGSARTTFSTEASIEDGPVVSRSSTRQKAKNGLDHGSVVRKDGSGELSKEPSAMPVAVKSRVVNVSERGAVKRGSSSQNDRHVSSAARKSSDQMAPIMETESKWLRRPGTADGQPPSDSFSPDRDDTRTSGRRRMSARGGALKSVDRNVDRVLPFKDPSRSPDDSTDEDDHHLDSPRSRKIMYREIGTVFKDDGVDEEDTPDSSHGEAFFQRRGYWAV